MKRILIISNGNDNQVPFLLRLYQSLRDPHRGSSDNDFLFLSDHLNDHSKKLLHQTMIPLHIIPAEKCAAWEKTLQPEKHPLGKFAKPFFIQEALSLFPDTYDGVVYLDPDILIQKPLNELTGQVPENEVWYSSQQVSTLEIRWAKMQLERALSQGHITENDISKYPHEINTGFLVGGFQAVRDLMDELMLFMTRDPFRQFASSDPFPSVSNAWHDQDYFRCFIRLNENSQKITLFNDTQVVHLCNNIYKEYYFSIGSLLMVKKSDANVPHLVHFAGGAWAQYPPVAIFYLGFLKGLECVMVNGWHQLKKQFTINRRYLLKYFNRFRSNIRRLWKKVWN